MAAIVTAGDSAIGRHLVLALAGAGHDVAFTHLGADAMAARLEAEATALGARARGWQSDAGDEDAVARLHAEAADWLGGAPDVLVNNAGIQTWASLLDLRADQWDAVMRVNLRGCFLNTQAFGRALVAAGRGGAVVNLGSGCNKHAFPRLVDYTASKGGIEQFTKVSAVELGPMASVSIASPRVRLPPNARRQRPGIMPEHGRRSHPCAGLAPRKTCAGRCCS